MQRKHQHFLWLTSLIYKNDAIYLLKADCINIQVKSCQTNNASKTTPGSPTTTDTLLTLNSYILPATGKIRRD